MTLPLTQQDFLLADPLPLYPFPGLDETIGKGESGSIISILQAVLQELCNDFIAPTPPAVTGLFDDVTEACILAWQSIMGIPQSGKVDRLFWDMLATLYNARLL